jgi:hypothetical protein
MRPVPRVDSRASALPFYCIEADGIFGLGHFQLAFSLKFDRLSNMTFSFYSYAWRFTYRNNRMRVAIV